ncbi:hypothetical protein AVEN_130425-1 [Araneus ventricosus]|uniref:Uncharacterized protein n=1 Tax=Araneus ventricosus TaxID=182803 RepID=A0A4Y2NAM1_ARAVE|nr:hypothetical protein AVEN_130425-1 [Araneus ventricosus]
MCSRKRNLTADFSINPFGRNTPKKADDIGRVILLGTAGEWEEEGPGKCPNSLTHYLGNDPMQWQRGKRHGSVWQQMPLWAVYGDISYVSLSMQYNKMIFSACLFMSSPFFSDSHPSQQFPEVRERVSQKLLAFGMMLFPFSPLGSA